MRIYGGKWNYWIVRVSNNESAAAIVRRMLAMVTGRTLGAIERARAESAVFAGYPRIGNFDNILIKATVASASEAFASLGKSSPDLVEFNGSTDEPSDPTVSLAPVRFIWRQNDLDVDWPKLVEVNGETGSVWATLKPDAEFVLPETTPIDVVPWVPPDAPTFGTGALFLTIVVAAVGVAAFLRR